MTGNEDNSIPIHRSLTRPVLIMGGERELVLSLGVVAGIFILSLAQLWSIILGIYIWFLGMFAITRAGKYDPQLSKVLIRSFRYKKFYPAQATPFAGIREVK